MPRPVRLATAAAVALVALAGPAAAHVTVSSPAAHQGGFATLVFQVPNESDTASTNRVEVTLPEDSPLAFVSVQPVAAWTVDVERTTLDEPLEAEGGEVTEAVSSITWSGGAIAPGEFQQFLVSAGPLPDDVDTLSFPTIQTYDDGEESAWIEATPEDGEEPDFPAPTLELEPPAADEHGGGDEETTTTLSDADGGTTDEGVTVAALEDAQDDADSARTLALVGVVAGVLGIVVAVVALVTRRRGGTT